MVHVSNMQKIILCKHTHKTAQELYLLINRYLIETKGALAESVNIISYAWNKHHNRLNFTLNSKLTGVKGSLAINRSDIILMVNIPLHMSAHKKVITENLNIFTDKLLTGELKPEAAKDHLETVTK